MKLNVTLSQKGLSLVLIPLLIQIILFGTLSWLHAQAEEEVFRAYRAGRIATAVNQLVRDIFDLASTSRDEIIRFTDGGFENSVHKIKDDMNNIQEAVGDDPDKIKIVDKSIQATQRAYSLLEDLHRTYIDNGPLLALESLKPASRELRIYLKQIVSHDLISMAQDQEKFLAQSPQVQARFRDRIKILLIASLLSSIVLSVGIAFWFYRGIVIRLKIMVDNIYRYASHMPLNPILKRTPGGGDEINELDRTFHQMTYAIAEGEQREKRLVEYSLDAIFSIDDGLRFRTVNPACEEMFGFSMKELLGRSVNDILTEDVRHKINELLYTAIVDQTKVEFETSIRHPDSNTIEALWLVQWVQNEKLLFCVVHDITRRREAEKMRQEVVAMVSHDLRTPLATIGSYFEMLATGMFGILTQRGMQLLHVAESNIARMVNLTNDLLDIEKSKAGMLTISCSEIQLNGLLEKSVKSVANLASNHDVHLDVSSTNLTVYADSNRVTQVLVNLLSNAIKFSPKQGIIHVKAEEKNGMAYVYVSDEGRGVPDHLKQTIFERFQQVDVADAADKGGSGLGLAICKAIVELHGGEIKVEDNAGQGSTFSFSLTLSEKTANTLNETTV